MRYHKTTEYAIRVMVYLANNGGEIYSVNRLSRILDIPYKYLGKIMHTLTLAGLVVVNQGKQGGYRVNSDRPPIYLYEVIDAIEGLESYDRCVLGFPECSESNPCPLHKYWISQQKNLKEMIYTVTLNDLDHGGHVKN